MTEPRLRNSAEVQAAILAPLRQKKFETYVFLSFPQDRGKARRWLGEIQREIAWTKEVSSQSGTPTRVGLSLTWEGIEILARNSGALKQELSHHQAFVEGSASRAKLLNDPKPETWVIGAREQRVHAIVTIASSEREPLNTRYSRLDAFRREYGLEQIRSETGEAYDDETEHFGFKDSISQPAIRDYHLESHDRPGERSGRPGTELTAAGEFILGEAREPREEGEPHCPEPPSWMANGSFQVFRRLTQDYDAFWKQVETQHAELVKEHPNTSISEEALGAKLVGRWKDGTPLIHRRREDAPEAEMDPNDFDYHQEGADSIPWFSHIRRMNPRNHSPITRSNHHRILRRGITFGPKRDVPLEPGQDRGLLFTAYMACIENQFEFLQKTWANSPDFPRSGTGPDPISANIQEACPIKLFVGAEPCLLNFGGFVQVTGAVYAFAPSRDTLERLSKGDI